MRTNITKQKQLKTYKPWKKILFTSWAYNVPLSVESYTLHSNKPFVKTLGYFCDGSAR